LASKSKLTSGAGIIFVQEGQDRDRQNRERETEFYAGIGESFCPENKRSPKKKSSPELEHSFSPKTPVLQKKKKRNGDYGAFSIMETVQKKL